MLTKFLNWIASLVKSPEPAKPFGIHNYPGPYLLDTEMIEYICEELQNAVSNPTYYYPHTAGMDSLQITSYIFAEFETSYPGLTLSIKERKPGMIRGIITYHSRKADFVVILYDKLPKLNTVEEDRKNDVIEVPIHLLEKLSEAAWAHNGFMDCPEAEKVDQLIKEHKEKNNG